MTWQKWPNVLTIAGSDSGGGAGIQADLKAITLLGGHGCTVITALTAQNTLGVVSIHPVPADFIAEQWQTVTSDLTPQAIKTGMLATAGLAKSVAEKLRTCPQTPYVCDPVMIATSGHSLLEPKAIEIYRKELLPLATLVTPNLPEAEALLGRPVKTAEDRASAARKLLEMGAKAVYLKGGHAESLGDILDYFTDGPRSFWLRTPKRSGAFHGTGCTFAAAAATGLAQGLSAAESVVRAQSFLANGLRHPLRQGSGSQVLQLSAWPDNDTVFPQLSYETPDFPQYTFARMDGPIGFYPIVPSVEWVERLASQGVKTVQLRIKDAKAHSVTEDVRSAARIAKRYGCRLFVNDFWEAALACGAYGVHLGQEDAMTADLAAIAKGGLRLGLSSHSYEEAARAHALTPSYIALGPIFATTTKAMPWQPQGWQRLHDWAHMLPYPVVAIGGLKLQHVPQCLKAGADGVAVITDLLHAEDVEKRLAAYLANFPLIMP